MIRRLLAGYLSVTAFILVVLGIPLVVLYGRHERAQLVHEVRLEATEVATFSALPIATGKLSTLDPVADTYGRTTNGRLVVVDRNGTSIADSDDALGRAFASRPEVSAALTGREAHGFRHSRSLDRDLFFVAVPVNSGGQVLGAVRITYPASFVEDRIRRRWGVLAAVGGLTITVVTLMSLAVARSVARPVRDLERTAARLGGGDLAARVDVPVGPPEVRSLAVSFNETATNLERLVGAQRAFVADASHQLRTPLAALRLRLENLEATASGRGRDDAREALAEAMRLSRLVDGLLVLARTDAAPAQPRPVDVDAVVRDRVANWAPLAGERGVDLVAEAHGGLALITPDSLDQILDNLIANAIDVAPASTQVRVVAARVEPWVDVHVIDAGPGMTAEQREAAFTRFLSSAPESSEIGGFGLGLAIARRLARRDGGDLTLHQASGGGLDALVSLPAA